jgi:hypothetical protein
VYVSFFLIPLESLLFIVLPVMMAVIDPTSTNTNVLIATTVVGFMTMLVQQGFTAYNARKQHRDDLEDRDLKAKELAAQYAAENEKLRHQTELRAIEVRLLLEQRQASMTDQQNKHADQMKSMLMLNREATEAVGKRLDDESAALKVTNVARRERNVTTDSKLDQIHTLVNSNMTAAMESELEARRASFILLQETIELKIKIGIPETEESKNQVSALKQQISELESKLRDRKMSTDLADALDLN